MKVLSALLLPALILVCVACGEAQEPALEDPTTTTVAPPSSTTPSTVATSVPTLDPDQSASVELAIVDLAQRLDVEPAEIVLVSFREVAWPDGSLGCPEEGKMYTQAVVDGYQIGLGHADRFFAYHGANDGD